MRASFPYLGRGSWLSRRDPRVILLAGFLFMIGAIQLRDARHLLVLLVGAFAYYQSAGIPFRRVRTQWAYLTTIIVVIAGLNTIITGGRSGGFAEADLHTLFRLPLLGAPITAEAVSLMASQTLRFIGIIAVSLPIAYCIRPGDLGVAARRLGLGDRLAFALDLTIRFIPSLGGEMAQTADAQRVRGYDPTAGSRNPFRRLRQLAPMLVPVTVGAIANAEDTIDAMDLRAFATGPRTWFRQLEMDRTDRILVVGFIGFAVACTVVGFAGWSQHWLLPFLV
jgi:energy-coupling factor transport system permease protein